MVLKSERHPVPPPLVSCPPVLGTFWEGGRWGGVGEVGLGRCGYCAAELPAAVGRGRSRKFCDATCRSRARRARTPPTPARCSVPAGLGRCAGRSTGAWYDHRGAVAAHTCAEHRELAGDLLRAGMPRGRKLDRWLPASVRWSPAQPAAPPGPAYQLTITLDEVYPPVWRRVHVPAGDVSGWIARRGGRGDALGGLSPVAVRHADLRRRTRRARPGHHAGDGAAQTG